MSNDKLPTPAEILEKHHPYSQGFTILDSTYEGGDIAKAMQEHTSAHTAALRQEVEELQSQLAKYREAMERIVVEAEDTEQVDWLYVAENMVSIAKEALRQEGE